MITRNELVPVGTFGKPHALGGEVNLLLDADAVVEPSVGDCIITEIDGLYVPFFAEGVRQRSADAFLLKFEGVDTEADARALTNKPAWMRSADLPEDDAEDDAEDADVLYLDTLKGWAVVTIDGTPLGVVESIDDTTDNILLVVRDSGPRPLLIPAVDEFFAATDPQHRVLTVELPEGFLETIR